MARQIRSGAAKTLGCLGLKSCTTTRKGAQFHVTLYDGKTGALRLKTSYDSNGNGTLVSGIWAHTVNETFDILAAGDSCSLADIRKVRAVGVRGVVLGRVLLERRFTLKAALKC